MPNLISEVIIRILLHEPGAYYSIQSKLKIYSTRKKSENSNTINKEDIEEQKLKQSLSFSCTPSDRN
jgi:hypothetical protein